MPSNYRILLFFIFCSVHAQSQTWQTVASGLWSDPAVWSGGVACTYSASDSIIISHNVELDSNIVLERNTYMRIDSSGGVCGHHNVTLMQDVFLHKYGELRIDSVFYYQAYLLCECPGAFVYNHGHMFGGSTLHIIGCLVGIQIWDECFPIIGINEVDQIQPSIFPNPNNGVFTVLLSELIQGTSLQIADITGQVIMQSSLNSYQSSIDISGYSSGIYIVQVNYPDGKAERVKVIKE
ncbi:MAG: T9SS type A sorting domain-containing protein [Bacteroidia bacterium]